MPEMSVQRRCVQLFFSCCDYYLNNEETLTEYIFKKFQLKEFIPLIHYFSHGRHSIYRKFCIKYKHRTSSNKEQIPNGQWLITVLFSGLAFREVKIEGRNRWGQKKATVTYIKWMVIHILLVKTSSFQSRTETLFNLLKQNCRQ